MSFIQCSTLSITTDASSAGSTQTGETLNGLLHAVQYVRSSTATAMSTTLGVTVTGETSGLTFLAAQISSTTTQWWMPRDSIHLSSAGSTAAGSDRLPICNERLTVAVSSGGALKTGTFRFYVS